MTRNNDNPRDHGAASGREGLRDLSPLGFAALGNGHVAYVREVSADGEIAFAVHSADGTRLAVLEDHDVAVAVIRQNDLEPVYIH